MGTNSTLLGRRVEDDSPDGFNSWPFMTVHNWGESPRGLWTLEIVDVENNGKCIVPILRESHHDWSVYFPVIFLNWSLIFHGTQANPSHQLSTATSSKVSLANAHLLPTDDDNSNNIARSRSTSLHNSFHTRHREKNRKNKQQNHYFIKQQYYPYNALSPSSSSSQATPLIHDQYQIEISPSSRPLQSSVTLFLALIAILNTI